MVQYIYCILYVYIVSVNKSQNTLQITVNWTPKRSDIVGYLIGQVQLSALIKP